MRAALCVNSISTKHFFAKVYTEAAEVYAAFRQRKLHLTVVQRFTVLRKML